MLTCQLFFASPIRMAIALTQSETAKNNCNKQAIKISADTFNFFIVGVIQIT